MFLYCTHPGLKGSGSLSATQATEHQQQQALYSVSKECHQTSILAVPCVLLQCMYTRFVPAKMHRQYYYDLFFLLLLAKHAALPCVCARARAIFSACFPSRSACFCLFFAKWITCYAVVLLSWGSSSWSSRTYVNVSKRTGDGFAPNRQQVHRLNLPPPATCVIGRIATRDPGIVQILRYFGFLFSSGFFAASARLERDYVHFLIGIWPISLCHKSGTTRVLPPYPSANAMCGTSFGSTCANGVLWNVVRHSVRFYLCASSKRVCERERESLCRKIHPVRAAKGRWKFKNKIHS